MKYVYRLTTDGRGEYRIEFRSVKDDAAPWQALRSGFRDLNEAREVMERYRDEDNAVWTEVE